MEQTIMHTHGAGSRRRFLALRAVSGLRMCRQDVPLDILMALDGFDPERVAAAPLTEETAREVNDEFGGEVFDDDAFEFFDAHPLPE